MKIVKHLSFLAKKPFFDKIATADSGNEYYIVNTLFFWKPNSKNSLNKAMLNGSIEFFQSAERFNNPLF